MKFASLKSCVLAATIAVGGTLAFGAEAAKPLPADPRAGSKAPEAGAPAALDISGAREKMLREQLASRSQAFAAERSRLLEQLKTATEEQRRTILAKMQEQQEAFLEAARETAKRANEDMRKQRAAAASPGGRRN